MEIAKVLEATDTRAHFNATGMEAGGGSPESFARFLHAESQKWATVVKAARITAE